MSALKLGVHSAFAKLGCDSALNSELLGGEGGEGVTEANLMQYVLLSNPKAGVGYTPGRVHATQHATQHANPTPTPTR